MSRWSVSRSFTLPPLPPPPLPPQFCPLSEITLRHCADVGVLTDASRSSQQFRSKLYKIVRANIVRNLCLGTRAPFARVMISQTFHACVAHVCSYRIMFEVCAGVVIFVRSVLLKVQSVCVCSRYRWATEAPSALRFSFAMSRRQHSAEQRNYRENQFSSGAGGARWESPRHAEAANDNLLLNMVFVERENV